MDTAVRQNNVQALGQILEQRLMALGRSPLHPPCQNLFQVRCLFKQGTLQVLAQHPAPADSTSSPASINVTAVFSALQQTLEDLPPQALAVAPALGAVLPIQLFLRLAGQQQPYARHEFQRILAPPPPGLRHPLVDPPQERQGSGAEAQPSSAQPADALTIPGALAVVAVPDAEDNQEGEREPALPALEAASPAEPAMVGGRELVSGREQWLRPRSMIGLAVGLLIGGIGLYGLTRPCVVGDCTPLQTAQQLSQESMQAIAADASAAAVMTAYQQVVEASYLLSTIPPWSSYREAAQSLLVSYESQAEVLAQIVSAQEQATAAAELGLNPPHPLEVWHEVQGLWQGAIAQLEQVPADSFATSLAQSKQAEYQTNLVAINRRIVVEQEAQNKVKTARDTAKLAEAREGIATSVESWQLAYVTWQVVVNQLQAVPQGTMAYAEAEQLLAIYRPYLAAARDRHTQEAISVRAFNQALTLAEQARVLEQQRQWSQAVEVWQEALTNAQQVPNNTSYNDQATPLISSYTTALTQAQDRLRVAVGMQSAKTDLDRICSGTPRICNYTLESEVIQVYITADYDQAVEQAIAATEMTGDYQTRAGVMAHVNSLLRAIAAISENSQLSIELYNSDGSLFGTYIPRLSGYVAER